MTDFIKNNCGYFSTDFKIDTLSSLIYLELNKIYRAKLKSDKLAKKYNSNYIKNLIKVF